VVSRGEGLRRIEEEIVAEKAAALGRAGERLEEALREAAERGACYDAARHPGDRERLAREYEEACQRAARARLALLIQREAVGLRHHRDVDRLFPEPIPLARRPTNGAARG